jgi:cytidylate kinase
MLQRDKKDSERSVAPLIPAEDSILIDSSGLSIVDVTKAVLDLVKQKGWVELI